MKFSIKVIVISLIVSLQFCQEIQDEIFWLSSFPSIKISNNSICGKSGEILMTVNLEEDPFNQTMVVYSEDCGLVMIDYSNKNNNKIIAKQFGEGIKVQIMTYQSGNNLWVVDSTNIYLFNYSSSNKIFQLHLTIPKQKDIGISKKIQFHQNDQRLIILSTFEVSIYDISNLLSVKYVQGIQGGWICSIIILEKHNLIFFGDVYYNIMRITNPDEISDPSKPINYEQLCQFDQYYIDYALIIGEKHLLILSYTYKQYLTVNLTKFFSSLICKDINFLTIFNTKVGMRDMVITMNLKYIINVQSFIGIQVIELKNDGEQVEAELFQQLDFSTTYYSLQLSKNNKEIIISNQNGIEIFEKQKTNYNKINPSLLNIPQNIYFDSFQTNGSNPWSCFYSPMKKLLFQAFQYEGGLVIKEDEDNHFLNITQTFKIMEGTDYMEFMTPFNNEKYIVLGMGNKAHFYDIQDIQNPVYLSSSDFGSGIASFISGQVTSDNKFLILSAHISGVIIADISDLKQPIKISQIHHNFHSYAVCLHVVLSSNENIAYGTYQSQGLVIYDVKDKYNPKILSTIITKGGMSSTIIQNTNFIILSDRQYGLKIINVEDPKNPKIISSIQINGFTKNSIIIHNNQFILSVSLNSGLLSLIDIRNIEQPEIIQQYTYKQINGAFDMCTTPNESIGYLILEDRIMRINLTPNVKFNIDVILLQEGSNIKNIYIDVNTNFKLGMNIKFKLIQVYPENKAQITGVQYYNEFKVQSLPQWASYSVVDQSLTVNLNKNVFDTLVNSESDYQNKQNISTFQQFIFLTQQQLKETDFISDKFQIDIKLSKQIFIDCVISNIISEDLFVIQSSQDLVKYLYLNKYGDEIVKFITYVLKSKITYYPIYFRVESSLSVNINNSNPDIQVITSIQNSVILEMSILNQAMFQNYLYPGVLVYYNDKYDLMKMEGDLDQINKILNQGIKLANFTNPDNIILSMKIDDKINYPITQTFNASHPKLIYLNKPISNNQNESIQADFDKKYLDSSVYILETFTFTFTSAIFFDSDSKEIKYEAKIILDDGNFINIPDGFWLSFQSEERTFFGTTKSSQLGSSIHIMINATDGYTSAQDYFTIHINKVPFGYVLTFISQILGPILGMIGLWKYRSFLYNQLYRKNYSTTKLEVQSGINIELQIPLLENSLKIAIELWNKYFNSLDKKLILFEMKQLKQNNEKLPTNLDQTNSNIFQYNSEQLSFSRSISLNRNQINIKNSPTKQNQGSIIESPSRKQSIFLKKLTNNISNSEIRFLKKQSTPQNETAPKKKQIYNQNSFFDQSGNINLKYLLNEILLSYTSKTKIQDTQIINSLKNPGSKLSQILKGLAAISFSKIEQTTFSTIEYLKKVSIESGFYEIDWYRYYVIIIPRFDLVFTNQFPEIQFDDEKLYKIFDRLEKMISKQNQEVKLLTQLIKDVIWAYSLGFTQEKRGFLQKITGECIEIQSHEIHSIKAYRPIKLKSMFCYKRVQEILVEKELSQNRITPSWITSIDITNDVILIQGHTQIKDIGEYVLKIFGKQNFILKELRIEIKNSNLQNLQNESTKKIEVLQSKYLEVEDELAESIHFFDHIPNEQQPTETVSQMNLKTLKINQNSFFTNFPSIHKNKLDDTISHVND